MKFIFAKHGIPEVVMSDNGTCYSSREFADFTLLYVFKHIISITKYSQSNGLAEKSVQTVLNIIRKCNAPDLGLLACRSSELHNGFSPSE